MNRFCRRSGTFRLRCAAKFTRLRISKENSKRSLRMRIANLIRTGGLLLAFAASTGFGCGSNSTKKDASVKDSGGNLVDMAAPADMRPAADAPAGGAGGAGGAAGMGGAGGMAGMGG